MGFREQWVALRVAPRELPMVYVIKLLTSFGLYSTTIVLTLTAAIRHTLRNG